MNPSTWDRLDQEFSSFPIMKASEMPDDDKIADAAGAVGCAFHDDYVAFLRRYGGAMVGSLPVFGLRPVDVMGDRWSVVELTQWFRNEGWPAISQWYIISEDGFGNAIGVAPDEQVMISDHDIGQVSVLAKDIEDFLTNHCLQAS